MSIANIMSWNMIQQSRNRSRRSEERRRRENRENSYTLCGERQKIHPLDDCFYEIRDSIALEELYTNAIKAMRYGCYEGVDIHD